MGEELSVEGLSSIDSFVDEIAAAAGGGGEKRVDYSVDGGKKWEC